MTTPLVLDLDAVARPERTIRVGGSTYPLLHPSEIGPLEAARLRRFGKAAQTLDELSDPESWDDARAAEMMAVLREGVRMVVPSLTPTAVDALSYPNLRDILGFFSESMGTTVQTYETTCDACGALVSLLAPTVILRVEPGSPTMDD